MYPMEMLRNAGWKAEDLKEHFFSAKEVREAGFPMGTVVHTFSDDSRPESKVEFLEQARKDGFTMSDFREPVCTAKELKAAGYTGQQMKDANFTAKEMFQAEFTLEELVALGFAADQLYEFAPLRDLLDEGLPKVDLLRMPGYTAQDFT